MGMEAFECRPTGARVFLVDDRRGRVGLRLGGMLARPGT